MSKNTVKKIMEQQVAQSEVQVEAKPGFFRRAVSWVKGLFSKGAKAVGRIVPDRVKTFTTSVARKIGNALSYAYDYVTPTLNRILTVVAFLSLGAYTIYSAIFLPLVFLATVGAGTLLFVAYAYLHAAREKSWVRAILKASAFAARTLWTAFKAFCFVSAFMGHWAVSLGLGLLYTVAIVLDNQTGNNERLERRRIVAEAAALVADPSMPAAATV